MAKIYELTSDVYNLISAGEVVESPTSVVKELVENALDAGATQITVQLTNGGTSQIVVTDNGCGIESSEVEKAFKKHATSKILTKEDIYKISTLGFRGEALASIACVSNVVLVTRFENEELGTEIIVEGGEIISKKQVPANIGTIIKVTKLFFNTPARYKFLRDANLEYRKTYKIMASFVLSHPELEFTLYNDGIKKLASKKGNLTTAIDSIFGYELSHNLLYVDDEFDNFKINGAIGLPYVTKANRSAQVIFVNNRVVESVDISSSVNAAYTNFLMKGRFPCFVLNITLPYEDVDVNISPQKTEVKITNRNKLVNWIEHLIKEILSTQEIKQEEEEREQANKLVEESLKKNNYLDDIAETNKTGFSVKTVLNDSNLLMDKLSKGGEEVTKECQIIIPSENPIPTIHLDEFESSIKDEKEDKLFSLSTNSSIMSKLLNMDKEEESEPKNKTEEVFHEYSQTSFIKDSNKMIGVLFNTYIMVERKDDFCLIDQHAVHERFIFDKLMDDISKKQVAVQELLVPYQLNVNEEEKNFIKDNIKELETLGFIINEFGKNSLIVTQIPLLLVDVSLEDYFSDILSNLNTLDREQLLLRHKIATKSCKAAIKAGYILTQDEIDKIIEMVETSKSPLLCPHGRPYVVTITKTQVEKWFKRVL